MDDLVEKIKKAEKVIGALTQLTLSIGTLLAVIKMVLESLMQGKKGKEFSHPRFLLNSTIDSL